VQESFEFEDGGRKFACSAEKMRQSSPEKWWWFRVSTDEHNRYAPFRVESGDTPATVGPRVVAFYDDMLVKRNAPTVNRWQRGGQQQAAAKTDDAKAEKRENGKAG
jgi:hypothetical protein